MSLSAGVEGFEVRSDTSGSYVVYLIHVTSTQSDFVVYKRYSQFRELYDALRTRYPLIGGFNFPPKSMLGGDSKEKRERRKRFDDFVKLVVHLQPLPPKARAFLLGEGPSGDVPGSPGGGGGGGHGGALSPGGGTGGDGSGAGAGRAHTHAHDDGASFAAWSTVAGAWAALGAEGAAGRAAHPVGVLELGVLEGFELPAADLGASSDPYVVATLTGYWSHGQEWPRAMRQTFRTEV